ncbi:MAG: PEGA domain-containing protein [Patescibacteria group bacterium]|nr:PEGA domain-containing protein [Patescibacteria group bacterium]
MFAKIPLKRRLIYTAGTLFFLTSSIILAFFALGYRFNSQHGVFIYSGTITIKSTPKDVDLYLDNKLVTKKSYDIINNAYNINGVKPGSYTLEVKSPNYSSWKKEIEVHSGIATEFWNIVLAENKPEKMRLDIVNPSFYKASEGGAQIVYATRANSPLSIFNYSTKEEKAIKIFEECDKCGNFKETTSLEIAEFSPSQNSLILGIKRDGQYDWYLAFLDKIEKEGLNDSTLVSLNPRLSQLASLDSQEAREQFDSEIIPDPTILEKLLLSEEGFYLHDFKWLDNDNFYFLNQGNLYLVTLSKKEMRLILEEIRGYEISQGNIFFIKAPSNLVLKSDYEGSNLKQITENLIDQDFGEEDPSYKLTIYDEKRLVILNQNKELYLYNDNDEEYQIFKKIGDNIQGAQFSNDGKKLLYFNEDEIKTYYLREWDVQPKNNVGANITIYENKQNKIQDAMWHHNYQHIIFSTNKKIQLVELDTRNKINQSIVLEPNMDKTLFSYDPKSRNLYFLDTSDQYVQLFSTELPRR